MKIGIDAKRAFCNFTGLGSYSRNTIIALTQAFPDIDFYLFTPKIKNIEFEQEVRHSKNVHIVQPKGFHSLFSSWWRTYGITQQINSLKIDVYLGLSNELPKNIKQAKNTKALVTIHDLIMFKEYSFQQIFNLLSYRNKIRHAAKSADHIISISQQTSTDLQKILNISESKISVIYQPIQPIYFTKPSEEKKEEVRKKYHLPQDFVLNVGRVELRKNIQHILQAMHILQKKHLHLVVVGKKSRFFAALNSYIQNFELSEQVHFLENVPNDDLHAIYHLAKMQVYPSLAEGFGLPVAESLASGLPIITTDDICFYEAGGEAAIYIDPYDENAIAQAIAQVLKDKQATQERVEKGFVYVQKFAHRPMVKEMMQAISQQDARFLEVLSKETTLS